MGHDKLANHLKTNFSLMHHHKWSLTELENLMPWERYIYIDMLNDFLIELEKEAQLKQQEQKAEMARIQRQLKKR